MGTLGAPGTGSSLGSWRTAAAAEGSRLSQPAGGGPHLSPVRSRGGCDPAVPHCPGPWRASVCANRAAAPALAGDLCVLPVTGLSLGLKSRKESAHGLLGLARE